MSIKFQSFTYIMEHVKPKGVAFCMSSTSMERLRSNVRLVRLALSGALLGVAAVGIVARGLGHSGHFGLDLAGAGAGFAAVLIFKLSHFV